MRFLALFGSLLLGLVTGVATVALHRTVPGLALGIGTTLVVMWTLRLWLDHAATVLAAGWLTVLVAALTGRGEGDYAVVADRLGWGLIVSGLAVLVLGIGWARMPGSNARAGSGPAAA